MRILALDLGRKRIGVAICDELGFLARTLTTIQARNRNADLAAIAALVQQEKAEKVLIGLPLHLNGEHGTMADKSRKFGDLLAAQIEVPVEYWDERLTTAEAARILSERGIPPRKQRDQIDAVAAAVLLQSYLDTHRQSRVMSDETMDDGRWTMDDRR